jgi:hypothetical protein
MGFTVRMSPLLPPNTGAPLAGLPLAGKGGYRYQMND